MDDDVTWVPAGGAWKKRLAVVSSVKEVVMLDPKWGGDPFLTVGSRSFRLDRERVYRTTDNFCKVFDLDFIEGNPETALTNPGSGLDPDYHVFHSGSHYHRFECRLLFSESSYGESNGNTGNRVMFR